MGVHGTRVSSYLIVVNKTNLDFVVRSISNTRRKGRGDIERRERDWTLRKRIPHDVKRSDDRKLATAVDSGLISNVGEEELHS